MEVYVVFTQVLLTNYSFKEHFYTLHYLCFAFFHVGGFPQADDSWLSMFIKGWDTKCEFPM